MAKRSKKYNDALEKINKENTYSVEDAIALIKDIHFSNTDSTIDVAYKLSLDTRQADQQLRGSLVLPHGTGKTQTVAVFATGEKATEAEAAGADFVGEDELIAKVQDGWLGFDVAVATPDMMAKVGRLGQILGPKGLMPNPKTGTVTMNVEQAVKDIKAGQVTYRTDRNANVQVPIGKVSFSDDALRENLETLHQTIINERPSAISAASYITNLTISSTFGPSVKVDKASIA